MKYIVQHEEKARSYIGQYAKPRVYIGLNYTVLDIEENYLNWLRQMTQYIEPDFNISIPQEKIDYPNLQAQKPPLLLAVIGPRQQDQGISLYYDMKKQVLETSDDFDAALPMVIINCFCKSHRVSAAEYISCIQFLANQASQLMRPLLIYGNIQVTHETYRYRGLTYKIINEILKNIKGMLIIKAPSSEIPKYYTPAPKPFEFYLDETLYLEVSLKELLSQAELFLYSYENNLSHRVIYRKMREALHHHVFDQGMPSDQER